MQRKTRIIVLKFHACGARKYIYIYVSSKLEDVP